MRYGVISDVHGNLHALAAALEVLENAHVDRYLCLGDLVGFGPFPNECVERVAALDVVCVAGNHDLIAVGRLPDARCSRLARESLRWTRGVLDPRAVEFLAGLPLVASPEPEVVLAHGSIEDPERYVVRFEHVRAELDRLADGHPQAKVLLLGHTHRPAVSGERCGMRNGAAGARVALPRDERIVLNPGSVGQSRQLSPYGSVAVLEWPAGQATFHTVRYDVAACRRALRIRGLPPSSCHRNPYTIRAAARRATRLVARTRRRLVGTAR